MAGSIPRRRPEDILSLIDFAGTLAGFAALVGAGAVAGRWRLIPARVMAIAGWAVFTIGLPSLVIVSLARADLGLLADLRLIACFVASVVVTGGIAWWIGRRRFAQGRAEASLYVMSSAYTNAVNLGFPVAQLMLGTVAPVATLGLMQMLVILPILLSLIEFDLHGGQGARASWARLPRRVLGNPVVLGCAIGRALHALPMPVPQAVLAPLSLIGQVAIPLSLLLLGHELAGGISAATHGQDRAPILAALGLKLVVQPAVAFLVGAFVFDLSAAALLSVVLVAGLPAPQNNYIFARRYGIATARTARIVAASTAAFGITALAILMLARH